VTFITANFTVTLEVTNLEYSALDDTDNSRTHNSGINDTAAIWPMILMKE